MININKPYKLGDGRFCIELETEKGTVGKFFYSNLDQATKEYKRLRAKYILDHIKSTQSEQKWNIIGGC